MTLSQIIAELEAAKEGSRELEAKIFAVTADKNSREFWRWRGIHSTKTTTDAEAWQSFCRKRSPFYTHSLDAALSLLAKGTLWAVIDMEDGPIARLCWPNPDGGFVGGYHEAYAATPALALCLAALKARAALATEEK